MLHSLGVEADPFRHQSGSDWGAVSLSQVSFTSLLQHLRWRPRKTGDWLIGHFVFSFTPHFLYLRCVFPHLSCSRSDLEIMTTELYLSFRMVTQKAPATSMQGEGQEKKERLWKKKINRFPLSGWAVSLTCQWPRYTPGTLDRHWQEESMLTVRRNKSEHRFALQEREGPSYAKGPCSGGTEEYGMRRQWALDQVFLRWGWGVECGLAFTPYTPPPPPWLSDCLTSLH